ncbi:glutaminyl-peptide cyclotransferase-like [Eurosta solidaginis]|uniref:glutaminyl-peptide cyclotransferase-like n=1 Tax=Eurosta solidaginis TaxID=178769 RepID=UPI003530F1D0
MAGSSNFITFFILSISVCVKQYLCVEYSVGRCQTPHHVYELSDKELLTYGQLKDEAHLRNAVENILIPRAVGTVGNKRVRDYISDSLRKLHWSVEYYEGQEEVRNLGILHFHNIIAKLNPKADRFLVLTCHYDSKNKEDYVGAIEGVPCAMLLNMAHVLRKALNPFRKEKKLSLMFIFFDGSEYIQNRYGPEDAFGSRHLATALIGDGTLNAWDILVILDLIGSAGTRFSSFFGNTQAWFSRFMALETRLRNAMKFGCKNPRPYFQPYGIGTHYLLRDSKEFLDWHVPVLHLTPQLSPRVWQTEADVKSNIDFDTTEDISRIIRLFIMEYLHSAKIN